MFLEKILFILGKIIFFTGSIFNGASFPKPLPPEEEKQCILKNALPKLHLKRMYLMIGAISIILIFQMNYL